MESMTDWAFSWPISAQRSSQLESFCCRELGRGREEKEGMGGNTLIIV